MIERSNNTIKKKINDVSEYMVDVNSYSNRVKDALLLYTGSVSCKQLTDAQKDEFIKLLDDIRSKIYNLFLYLDDINFILNVDMPNALEEEK